MSCTDQMLSDTALRSALENPCLAQGPEMECATEFGVTTFNKCICLAAIACFLHKPSLLMEEKNIYGHDCSSYTGTYYTIFGFVLLWFFNEMLPKSPAIRTGFSVSHQYSYFEFTICTGPWWLQPSKVSVHGVSICIQYIVFITKEKNVIYSLRMTWTEF